MRPGFLDLRLLVRSTRGSSQHLPRGQEERGRDIYAEVRWQCLDLCQVTASCWSGQVPIAPPGERGKGSCGCQSRAGVPHLCKESHHYFLTFTPPDWVLFPQHLPNTQYTAEQTGKTPGRVPMTSPSCQSPPSPGLPIAEPITGLVLFGNGFSGTSKGIQLHHSGASCLHPTSPELPALREEHRLQLRQKWDQIPTWPLKSCVSLGRLLNLYESHFSFLYPVDDNSSSVTRLWF